MSALAVYAPMLPELILAIGAMALLMFGVFRPETQDEASRIMWLAVAVLLAAGFAVLQGEGTVRLFDGAFIGRLVEQHQSGMRDHSQVLWALLMFEAFARRSLA